MKCIFPGSPETQSLTEPFKSLLLPALKDCRIRCHQLAEGNLLEQYWEWPGYQVFYFTGLLRQAFAFEFRHERDAAALVLNLNGKFTLTEYAISTHLLATEEAIIWQGKHIQGYGTFRFSHLPIRVLLLVQSIPQTQTKEEPLSVQPHPFTLNSRLLSLIDQLLYPEDSRTGNREATVLEELFSLSLKAAIPLPAGIELTADEIVSVQEVKKIIDQSPEKEISLTVIARRAGLHVKKLSRGFYQLYGKSIFHYLREQRLLIAQEKILFSRTQLKQISRNAGYKSYSNFSFAFRSFFGYTPMSLRKQKSTRS